MFLVLVVNALVVWSLLAVGSVYAWGVLPVAVTAVAITCAVRPRLGGTRSGRLLDGGLAAVLLASGLQLLPLPPALWRALSPAVTAYENTIRLGGARPGGWHTLSLDPGTTAYTLGVTGAILLLFWSCRHLFSRGGVRRTVRTISLLGLGVAVLAIVQRGVAPGRVYGVWTPVDTAASPIGPVVNANQFAAWLLLALSLVAGYLVAHQDLHVSGHSPTWRVRLRVALDARVLLLASSVLLMTVTVLFSGSRSALSGLLAGAAFSWVVAGRRSSRIWRLTMAAGVVLVGVAALAWVNLDALGDRLTRVDSGMADRATIWRDTLSVAGRFWLAGVGLGSYQAAMIAFQTATRDVFFNHAHSQYLQVVMEGGVLLSVPVAMALAGLIATARRRLADDHTPMWNIRMGAAAGLVAVAVQGLWETILRMPANGVLIAVAAAVLVHAPPDGPGSEPLRIRNPDPPRRSG